MRVRSSCLSTSGRIANAGRCHRVETLIERWCKRCQLHILGTFFLNIWSDSSLIRPDLLRPVTTLQAERTHGSGAVDGLPGKACVRSESNATEARRLG